VTLVLHRIVTALVDPAGVRAGSVRPVSGSRSRLLRVAGAVAILLLFATGCQVQIHTTVTMQGNGQGTVTQAVGFDDAALRRVGNLDQQLHVDDLAQAGWTVDPAVKEGDTTWVRAHHPFSSPAEATRLVGHISGPDGPYRDVVVKHSDGLLSSSSSVTGVIDTTAGFKMFGDPALVATMGGDGTGGLLERIAKEEGRPAADMVMVSFTSELPGISRTTDVVFSDSKPSEFKVGATKSNLMDLLRTIVVVALVGGTVAVIALRVRARRLRTRSVMRRGPFQR